MLKNAISCSLLVPGFQSIGNNLFHYHQRRRIHKRFIYQVNKNAGQVSSVYLIALCKSNELAIGEKHFQEEMEFSCITLHRVKMYGKEYTKSDKYDTILTLQNT